jgi:hypothetical protein
MKNQKMPILLILMMLITPIASAFDHCSGMDMTGHLLENQSLINTVSSKDEVLLDQKGMLSGDKANPVEFDCHTYSCTLHACGGYSIVSSATTINSVISFHYSYFEYFSPYDTYLSRSLRPPILAL